MDLRLASRRILVTGASRGIGRAIARRLAEEGCAVAVGARGRDKLEEAASDMNACGDGTVWSATLDVRDREQVAAWVEAAATSLGGIDGVVAVPSGNRTGIDPQDWVDNLETDILGAVNLLAAATPHLVRAADEGGDAACVFVGSAAATVAYEPSAYGPIKAAMVNLALGYARQLARQRIRVNVVSPGMICFEDSGIQMTVRQDPERAGQLRSMVPLARFGTLDEVANAVLFLISPLSSYTTGVNLRVDGAISSHVDF